jgi:hypothetical protein
MDNHFAPFYWIVAIGASTFYGWKAVEIHSFSSATGGTSSGEAAESANTPYPWAWVVHQAWLNFLGAFVGWLALWILGRRFWDCVFGACSASPGGWDILSGLVAFVGMTGFLPGTVVSLVAGLSMLASRLSELLVNWIARRQGGA